MHRPAGDQRPMDAIRRSRAASRWQLAAGIMLSLAVVFVIIRLFAVSDMLAHESAAHERDSKAADAALSRAQEQYGDLYRQYVEKTGEKPASVPSPAAVGKQGPAGQDATIQQVSSAVQAYCDQHGGCKGEKGKDGDSATVTMVAAAVAAYCDAHNGCAGRDGQPGQNGQNGDAGGTGGKGDTGAAGVSVTAMTCTDGRWVASFSDGQQQVTNAACSTEPAPTEVPTPAPS